MGMNYLFRNGNSEGQSGNYLALLDDLAGWGPGQGFAWQTGQWYWLRLRQEPNAASQGGANNVFAKAWLADGNTAEPPELAAYLGLYAGNHFAVHGFCRDHRQLGRRDANWTWITS